MEKENSRSSRLISFSSIHKMLYILQDGFYALLYAHSIKNIPLYTGYDKKSISPLLQ